MGPKRRRSRWMWRDPVDRGFAPAKVNLALHVTGQRADGYHLLDSLVVFGGLGDQISATPSRDLTLSVTGPFAAGVPADDRNLVLKAAHALAAARGVTTGASLRLTKALPHAAGIGGGSSDAAATIRLLSALWKVPPLDPGDPAVRALGADVPVCLAAPAPQWMAGTGERLAPWPALPGAALVLANPRIDLPTREVFAGLARRDNPPLTAPPANGGFDAFAGWLSDQRNDMEPAAIALAPPVAAVLARLAASPGVAVARMSGSGATCYGLCRDLATAKRVAKAIQIAEQGWWVAPMPVLGG